MKKIYLLFVSLLISGLMSSSYAQKSININNFADSTGSAYCLPNATAYMWASIQLTGYTLTDSVDVLVNWGDGSSSTQKVGIFIGTTNQWAWINISHTYSVPGTYIPQMIAEMTGGLKDTSLAVNSLTVATCGNLTGKAYLDNNNDCVFNTGDVAFSHMTVVATDPAASKSYFTSTNALGEYDIEVPNGATYDVNLNSPYLTLACPVGGHTGVSVPSTGIDLGLQCGPGFDLFGSAHGFAFRPGFNRSFYAKAFNASCNPMNATLKVVLSDSRIQYSTSSHLNPPTISGDTLIWNYTGLDYTTLTNSWANHRGFYVLTDTTANVGDTICFDVIVEPSAGDSDPSNNTTTYCFPVNNSYDPNEKAAQPLGVGPENIIAPGTTLDYTVFFQNTGNDTAYNVFILDEIDENLDLSTLSIMSSSHQMDWVIFDNNTIRFNFPNINLLDSNSNEPLSHGYVSYRITPKANTPLGTVIENTAGIYFDFNDPIITNTTSHKVDILSGINGNITKTELVNIYPNPTTGAVTVDLLNSTNGLLTVKTLVGQSLQSFRLVEGKNSIDVSGLSSGIYLMEINNGSQTQVKRVIVH